LPQQFLPKVKARRLLPLPGPSDRDDFRRRAPVAGESLAWGKRPGVPRRLCV